MLSESPWSLNGVGADWSGLGPIMILCLVIGPSSRSVVFHLSVYVALLSARYAFAKQSSHSLSSRYRGVAFDN